MTNGVAPDAPKELYGMFAGPIDQAAAQRISNAMSLAINNGVQGIHLLFQSGGGNVGDGIYIFNLFRSLPISLTLYNAGSIASIAVIAYLGAAKRITTSNATFMVHRTYFSPVGATSGKVQSAANTAILDEKRIESILQSKLKLPEDKLKLHSVADLWLSADEAVAAGLATSIGDFSPPKGQRMFYIGAP
jgi:ATP-dependent Clp protease, protease subunit